MLGEIVGLAIAHLLCDLLGPKDPPSSSTKTLPRMTEHDWDWLREYNSRKYGDL